MRRAVIGADAIAPRGIDRQMHGVADLQRAGLDRRLMRVQPPQRLAGVADRRRRAAERRDRTAVAHLAAALAVKGRLVGQHGDHRSEEHTSELQSLMRISYAVFCLKKKKKRLIQTSIHNKKLNE